VLTPVLFFSSESLCHSSQPHALSRLAELLVTNQNLKDSIIGLHAA